MSPWGLNGSINVILMFVCRIGVNGMIARRQPTKRKRKRKRVFFFFLGRNSKEIGSALLVFKALNSDTLVSKLWVSNSVSFFVQQPGSWNFTSIVVILIKLVNPLFSCYVYGSLRYGLKFLIFCLMIILLADSLTSVTQFFRLMVLLLRVRKICKAEFSSQVFEAIIESNSIIWSYPIYSRKWMRLRSFSSL